MIIFFVRGVEWTIDDEVVVSVLLKSDIGILIPSHNKFQGLFSQAAMP